MGYVVNEGLETYGGVGVVKTALDENTLGGQVFDVRRNTLHNGHTVDTWESLQGNG